MEIRIFFYHFYIGCVLIASYTDCKTFSLNDVIGGVQAVSQSPEKFVSSTGSPISQSKKTSSLKYKKTFQITTPSKPKKLRHLQRQLNKRKNFTSKRETQQNENKYIPLLRNIGMLFDNILSSSSSEIQTIKRSKYKRNQFTVDDQGDTCTCVNYGSELRSGPQKKTAFTSSTVENESETVTYTITTTTPSNYLATDNISPFRWNKNVPILLARNPSSVRRNNNRFRPRSSSTYKRSSEGHITRVSGDNEYHTNGRETKSNKKYDEKDSDSNPRDNSDSDYGVFGRYRGIRRDSDNSTVTGRTRETKEFLPSTNETYENATGIFSKYEGETQYETGRNKTESPIFIPKFTSGLREYNTDTETSETGEKSITFNYTGNKRVSNGNGSNTSENKRNSETNKTLGNDNMSNSSYPAGKVVMIYDGYSIAKDVNGENKWSEKAIHIHS